MMLSSGQMLATLESTRLPAKGPRRRFLKLGASLLVLALILLYAYTKVATESISAVFE
jgi:hypothetical protein